MSAQTDDTATTTDGLWRWLLGGLASGGAILGLLIAAYAIGYHHGIDHSRHAAASPTRPATTTVPPTTTTAPPTTTSSPVQVTPALVAQGKSLFSSVGCSACHSLSGAKGVGPPLDGLAGGAVSLTTGQSASADDAYLERSITDPNAQIVKGYGAGVMSAAIAGQDLAAKPNDVRALVAFIKSQK